MTEKNLHHFKSLFTFSPPPLHYCAWMHFFTPTVHFKNSCDAPLSPPFPLTFLLTSFQSLAKFKEKKTEYITVLKAHVILITYIVCG